MKKDTKQNIIFITVILLVLAAVIFFGLCLYHYITHHFTVFDDGIDFSDNRSSFRIVKNKLVEIYDDEKQKNSSLNRMNLASHSDDMWEVVCEFENGEVYSISVSVTEKEAKALKSVYEAPYGEMNYFSNIAAYDDFVEFYARSGRIHYSRNNKKPDLDYDDGSVSLDIHNCGFGWYNIYYE
jgi:hypothetical protein